ncbi:GT2 family glycosyltransferase [Nonomuraea fuscirosea]|uniref:GT2 family glycosyltransferase n=1 Tax=Nonomuraea fuscirosea TaxID=1291556 RepID=A0A2T0MN30_9ACTN|nr:glycosyltransferase family 2 protein [Nonomuraea fuscirosea]PRX59296.1 GT2 family glycosyltransferase [Nonomuraea fuscirosea]
MTTVRDGSAEHPEEQGDESRLPAGRSASAGRVRGNDYRVLDVPGEDFTPAMTVSVVIPAYGGRRELDLVLAALARQTYPAELTEVVVVDNGSEPPLRLPAERPAATRLIRCERPGRAAARNAGLAAASGEVIHWLDSDVVLTPGAIEAHMRWHHAVPYAVVTGYLRFTEAVLPAELPADLDAYFEPAEPHAWIVDLVDRTDGLTANPQRPFSLHVGGATSVNARLIAAAGPMDDDLVLGQDTEMGYRLWQAGAVFVPEPAARAYHLGPTMRMRDKQPVDRVSHAFVADRIPAYRWLRGHPGRQWKVPYVTAVVDGTAGYDPVRASVDALLAGTVPDVSVLLTGPWDTLDRDRRAPLKDPALELVLVHGHYEHEGRVRLAASGDGGGHAGADGAVDPAVPYVLRLPAGWIPGEDTLARLLDLARDEGLGLVNVLLRESAEGVVTARLERAAAFARARLVAAPGEDLDDAVDTVSGVVWVDGDTYGFTTFTATEARTPQGRRGAYRAGIEARAEVERLTAEAERLRGQIAKWKEEAGRWRKSAVELRREVGTLRRGVAAAERAAQAQQSLRTVVSATKRALRKRLRG